MNLNLISPEGNGFAYNVRFAEPIIIPENASVSFNWGQFERDNKVRFSETQQITLNLVEEGTGGAVLPYWDWYDNGRYASNPVGVFRKNGELRIASDLTFEIDKGSYTLSELQTAIGKAFAGEGTNKRICNYSTNDRGGVIPMSPPFAARTTNTSLICQTQCLVLPPIQQNQTFLELGIVPLHITQPMSLDMSHKKDVTLITSGLVGDPHIGITKTNSTTDGTFEGNGRTNATSYNSYNLGAPYNHEGGNFSQYDKVSNELINGGFDDFQECNGIFVKLLQEYDAQQGNIYVGLYSQSYAGVNDEGNTDGTDGTVTDFSISSQNLTDRTNLANLVNIQSKNKPNGDNRSFVPQSYFGVEIVGEHSGSAGTENDTEPMTMNFYSACLGQHTKTLNDNIENMFLIGSVELDSYRDATINDPVEFVIQTYSFDLDSSSNRGELHIEDITNRFNVGQVNIRVGLKTHYTDRPNGYAIVYDSYLGMNQPFPATLPNLGVTRQSFSAEFMDSMKAAKTTANNASSMNMAEAKASGFPFAPIVAFTESDEGVEINYVGAPDNNFSDDRTHSLIRKYSLTMSNELVNLFHTTTKTNFTLEAKLASSASYDTMLRYMNYFYSHEGGFQGAHFDNNPFIYRDNHIINQALTDKFAVVLNNLPIKSFKNTSDKSKSGYRKPILANIPAPFSGSRLNVGAEGTIVGSYVSSLGINNRLSNQVMTTNNIDVQIIDLENDRPAEQLTKSIVNFTISAE